MDRIEIKAALSVDESGVVTGNAWPFGSPDIVGDVITKGAFNSPAKLPMLFAHSQEQAVGVWDSIVETDAGLSVKGRLLVNDVARAAEVRALVREGAVTGLSIGFVTKKSAPRRGGGRTITNLDLHEISIVPVPSHPGARISTIKGSTLSTETTEVAPDIAALETKLTAIETTVKGIKLPDLAPLEARLAEVEKKANRPAGTVAKDEQAALETKALSHFIRTGSDVEVKAAASDNNVGGGWLVLPTIDTSIRALMTDISPMRQLAEVVSIGTSTYERFYSLGKRGAQWVAERDDRPQDTARPELIKHSYGVAELYAAPAATRQLLDDAQVDIASWLINNATHDIAETLGENYLRGDGVMGKPKGLLTYESTNERDFVRAWGKFQYTPAGHASAPTDANLLTALIKLVASLRTPYKANARFVLNSNTAVRLRTIVDANGRYLWAPTGNLIDGIEHPLLGYPVTIDDGFDDIGAGTFPIAFGDFRQGFVAVDRSGIRVNRDELTQKGRIVFDVYSRHGGGAGDFNAIKFLKVAAS